MTKTELIDQMAREANISKVDAQRVVDSFINSITNSVKKGDKVILIGFGTFSLSTRKAREGRNPRTGEIIKIPASNIPKFVPGRAFKDALNE
ncbi:MAG: HU family DNA-binding protein [Candidatus Magnetoovum sp. WYHC-5]|nr:HU family DNA-binding protein [Candidatus Magnetoovum sp. WYHC-5]